MEFPGDVLHARTRAHTNTLIRAHNVYSLMFSFAVTHVGRHTGTHTHAHVHTHTLCSDTL